MATPSEATPLRGDASSSAASSSARPLLLRRVTLALAATAALAALVAVLHVSSSSSSSSSSVSAVSTVSAPPSSSSNAAWFCGEPGVEADYIKLKNKRDDHYFYWFAPSRSPSASSDPLVVWLNGGPGSSSLEGLLTENGPCLVQPDLSLKRNAYAWNNHANVIWLEQPSGVGFSYFTDDADKDATGEDIGRNMYAFLDGFLDKHPEFVGRPLYLTGESYAGHYIPAAAYYIWSTNKQLPSSKPKRVNLQGVAIGNGDPNLVLQYKYSVEMATNNNYNLTLLTDAQISKMKKDSEDCATLLATCRPYSNDSVSGCLAVSGACDDKMLSPFLAAKRNVYDIRQWCDTIEECYDTDGGVVEKFLGSEAVQTALKSVLQGRVWGSNGDYVNQAYLDSGDWARVYTREIADMLNDGLRMLIFAGDADLVCNWLGNRAWTLDLEWKGKQGYNKAAEAVFTVPVDPLGLKSEAVEDKMKTETKVAGSKWHFDNLAFVRIGDAGHLVPKNQPLASYVMIDRFLNNQAI